MSNTITTDEAEQINDALGEDGSCREYSGRGMYGRQCFGVNISRDFSEFKLALIMVEVLGLERAIDMADSTRSDSMGLGSVVYWPGWTLAQDTGDKKDEDCDMTG